jgi:hypothetical protein
LNGLTVNVGNYFLLIAISTIGSAGTAPVPSASLVLIITAYNTVFNTTGVPNGFEYILAIDWFMDRLRTTLNVTGDSVVTGIVASKTPKDAFDHLHDGDVEKHPHASQIVAKSLTNMVSEEDPSDEVVMDSTAESYKAGIDVEEDSVGDDNAIPPFDDDEQVDGGGSMHA